MSIYRVTGRATYRGHNPGELFEAVLDQGAEERAFTRGNIKLVERSTPRLKDGSYRRPRRSQ